MQQSGFQNSYLSLNIYVIKSSFRSPLKAFKSVSRFANTVSVEATHSPCYFLSLVPPLSSACLSFDCSFMHDVCERVYSKLRSCFLSLPEFFCAPNAHRLISSMKCCIWILCTGVAALISVHLEASPLCWESVDLGAIWCNSSAFWDKALFP